MISPKKLMKLTKKWQKLAASRRLRISLPITTTGAADAESCSTSSTAENGHFVVYTTDQIRFVIPLKYLKNNIISELFRIAEDEFGLPGRGPITLPCDAIVMEYVVYLIQKHVTKDVEKAILLSLSITGHCLPSSYLHQEQYNQQPLICSF